MNEEIQAEGTEYEWLALDQRGALASFSTNGSTLIPRITADRFCVYDAIIEAVLRQPATHEAEYVIDPDDAGPFDMWIELSKRGFYSYDFRIDKNFYALVSRPIKRLQVYSAKPSEPFASDQFVEMDIVFAERESIGPNEICRALVRY